MTPRPTCHNYIGHNYIGHNYLGLCSYDPAPNMPCDPRPRTLELGYFEQLFRRVPTANADMASCTSASPTACLAHAYPPTSCQRSTSASPTACPLRGYGRAGTQNDRLAEAVVLSTGTSVPAQWACRRRCRDRAGMARIDTRIPLPGAHCDRLDESFPPAPRARLNPNSNFPRRVPRRSRARTPVRMSVHTPL